MIRLINKLILYPVTLLIFNIILSGIDYSNAYEPIIIGLFLAVLSHILEIIILKKGTLWINTGIDYIATFLLIYLSQYIFNNSHIAIFPTLFISALISIFEHFNHLNFLQNKNRSK
ncbi:DUF2512 family protein [Clostridium pasteurianum]|uniref:DUF2512 family protein n=1 Tax=Clostridium pasteurianum BC1 TaxID=86416 RepID=R4K2C0_CLOPA|nr:DUF2512 family protein [Clostridium pasteurianum]AGK97247.1 Protein of unknown function (DUF2512) [Clostridium pasteurianum BC1]